MVGNGSCCYAMYVFFTREQINLGSVRWMRNEIADFIENNAEFFGMYWITGNQSVIELNKYLYFLFVV